LVFVTQSQAQIPPLKFNYSGAANDSTGFPIQSATISFEVAIQQSSPSGTIVYSERHVTQTDTFGIFSLVIGGGVVQTGQFSAISWGTDNFYLHLGMDVSGGTNFQSMGSAQMLSVPYAMHSATAHDLINNSYVETDPIFDTSSASGISILDTTNWDSKQDLLIAGNGITISGDTITETAANGWNFTHYIGEYFGGGIIFHLWRDSSFTEHGLIVDIVNVSSMSFTDTNVALPVFNPWDGMANTNAIVAFLGSHPSAASVCANSTNSGFSDWYLPSADELCILGMNYFIVKKSLSTISGATGLPNEGQLFSSTFSPGGNIQGLTSGGLPSLVSKNTVCAIRAIRSF
jgi:hypothetical protein